MRLIRLTYGDYLSHRLWPDLRTRIFAAGQAEAPGTNVAKLLYDIELKWMTQPNLVNVHVAISDSYEIIGHAIAWVEFENGEPYIFLSQMISDPGSGALMQLKDDYLTALREWIDYLNSLYAKVSNPLRIPYDIKFITRHEDAFLRIFKGRSRKDAAILEIDVSLGQTASMEVH